jgi:hypothetical protein
MAKIQVISGGQTGVDQAALRAAKRLKIPTGGWMPFGWTTEEGPRPDFAELYGMKQCSKPGYPARTRANVSASDLTIWYGATGSRGCAATSDACLALNKRLTFASDGDVDEMAVIVAAKADEVGNIVINCAGNRESGNLGIGEKAEAFWTELFTELKETL